MSSYYTKIVPHTDEAARGIDFCGVDKYYYIIRSDVGAYMRSTNFNTGENLEVFQLHDACRWGDHYLAYQSRLFYIIKGSSFRRTSNMNSDDDSVVYSLHKNCQGGSNYCSYSKYFYIMFPSRGVYRRVTNMNKDTDAIEYTIHTNFMDGIYFWGTKDYLFCLKQPGDWGLNYHRSTDMHQDKDPKTWIVNSNVVNFLPGGVADTHGKAFGYWQLLKSIKNDSDSTADWEKTVKEKVGFELKKMSSMEKNWSIHAGATYNNGYLTEAFSKFQFNLDIQYGGKAVNTSSENWSQTTEVSEKLLLHILAGETVYVWQYQMGFGDEINLFCINLVLTDTATAPVDPPSGMQTTLCKL